jgi:hypothetical protein
MTDNLNVSRFLQTNSIATETIIGLSGLTAYRTNIRLENEVFTTTSFRDYLEASKNTARAQELDLLYPGQRNRVYASQEEYLKQFQNIPITISDG